MANEKRTLTFMAACREFFGQREGTTALDFGKEVKALSPADRAEMAPQLAKELGAEITGV